MQDKLVVSLSCNPMAHGHGGQRRSLQILQILQQIQKDVTSVPIKINHDKGIIGKCTRYLRGWNRSRRIFGFPRWSASNNWCGAHELPIDGQTPGIWVIENTQWPNAIIEAKNHGWRVIAIPQNLESLNRAREQGLSPEKSARKFADEVAALAQADAIFCICREEQYLLNCVGIKSGYLPYFPPNETIVSLESVRQCRNIVPKQFLLMLVNVHNAANRNGVISFFSSINDNVLLDLPPIVLAGFGTEMLAAKLDPGKVRVVGTLDDSSTKDYQSRAIAILVHQEYGTGCLTKICDFLIAGIPVLANELAARSYYDAHGLYVYKDIYDIVKIIKNGLIVPSGMFNYQCYNNKLLETVELVGGK